MTQKYTKRQSLRVVLISCQNLRSMTKPKGKLTVVVYVAPKLLNRF